MISLTRISASPIPLEVFGLLPSSLQTKTIGEIEKTIVLHGNRKEYLAEHARVEGEGSDSVLSFVGDWGNAKGIGAKLDGGKVIVQGNAGWHAGAQMTAGELIIEGSVGDWLGAEMKGGKIHVKGNAGHQAGAAYRGSRRGMMGGSIDIEGDAGDELGLLMRRGLIAVKGNSGAFTAASMIAGTILVTGTAGPKVAAGMKRGSVITSGPVELHPGLVRVCDYSPAFLGLFPKLWLKDLPWNVALGKSVELFRGDVITGGKGEVWKVGIS